MDVNKLLYRIRKLPLFSAKLVDSLLSGNYRSVFKGPGLEFDEVREYVEGDDARRIDWNVSSRMGSPYTKTYKEERELTLFLIIDVSPSMTCATMKQKSEMATTVAALLSYAAVFNNDQVGAVFYTDKIEKWISPIKGKKQVARLFQDMLSMQPSGKGSDLGLAAKTVHEALKQRGVCVVISDFKSSSGWKELSILNKKHDVLAIKIEGRAEEIYPFSGYASICDPETGEIVHAAGASKGFVRHYDDFWDIESIRWNRDCVRRGIKHMVVHVDDDPVKKLLLGLGKRRKQFG